MCNAPPPPSYTCPHCDDAREFCVTAQYDYNNVLLTCRSNATGGETTVDFTYPDHYQAVQRAAERGGSLIIGNCMYLTFKAQMEDMDAAWAWDINNRCYMTSWPDGNPFNQFINEGRYLTRAQLVITGEKRTNFWEMPFTTKSRASMVFWSAQKQPYLPRENWAMLIPETSYGICHPFQINDPWRLWTVLNMHGSPLHRVGTELFRDVVRNLQESQTNSCPNSYSLGETAYNTMATSLSLYMQVFMINRLNTTINGEAFFDQPEPVFQFQAPSGWTCPQEWYGDREGCDCNCGSVVDSDCGVIGQEVLNCSRTIKNPTCRPNGQCTTRRSPPRGWTCGIELYDSRDGCHCACGAPDPDCEFPQQPVRGCYDGPSPTCSNGMTCVYNPTALPATWQGTREECHPSYYNSNDGCDCECGAWDPDCDIRNTEVYNCDAAGKQKRCIKEAANGVQTAVCQQVPASWVCNPQDYKGGPASGCQCNCGAPDPDCNVMPAGVVWGCPCSGMTCSVEGFCEGTCQGKVITPRKEGSNVLLDGDIAGIVIGSMIAGSLICAAAVFVFMRRKGASAGSGKKTAAEMTTTQA